jgi:hypothetical protein
VPEFDVPEDVLAVLLGIRELEESHRANPAEAKNSQ